MLFVRGGFSEIDNSSIAIVGTRCPTPYGTRMAERFAAGLAKLGLPVVSGLARGIDTSAHRAALREGGRTIAVIGSGVDVIYPSENKSLADHIVAHGAVVSECDMGAKPDAVNFPRRNRIISGISLATLVVETAPEGGAMITAGTALDQNREVFAVPGAVGESGRSGTHRLIKEGKALLVESIDDIIAELAPRLRNVVAMAALPEKPPQPDLNLFERKLYDALGDDPLHIDVLAERTGLVPSDALVQLLSLEFKGVVRQLPGKMFARV
jgi:DNA processing protein